MVKLGKYLSDLWHRSPRAADTPDTPQPSQPPTYDMPAENIQPQDQEHELEFIEGTNITMDRQRRSFIVNGELVTYLNKPRRYAGCGCAVIGIGENPNQENSSAQKANSGYVSEEQFQLIKQADSPTRMVTAGFRNLKVSSTNDDQQTHPRIIRGTCKFCEARDAKLVKKGRLPAEQLALYATYCDVHERQCENCHTSTCAKDNLKTVNPDGSFSMLCPDCRTAVRRQRLVSGILQLGSSLFVTKKQEPPPQNNSGRTSLGLLIVLAILISLCKPLLFPTHIVITSAMSQLPAAEIVYNGCDNQKDRRNIQMHHQRDGPSDWGFLFEPNARRRFLRSLQPEEYERILRIESELRTRLLWYREDIKFWFRKVVASGPYNRAYALEKLELAIEADRIEQMRHFEDPFRPLGPEILLRQGDLHLLNQVVDYTPWMVSRNAPLRGVFLAGPIGSGKSRFIVSLCRQLVTADPPVKLLIIDPKGSQKDGLVPFAPLLNADVVDISEISLDFSPPGNKPYSIWLPEILPFIASQCSLIQSTDLVLEAGDIASGLRDKFIEKTGKNTEICLQDVHTCLSAVRNTDRGRRAGYLDAAQTSTSRILKASGNLFICRRGIPIGELFDRNLIISCSSLTDELACKIFVTYLLYWKFAASRDETESRILKNLVVVDDAQRFLSARTGDFNASSPTTPLSHVLSVLRSSGCGLMAATQLPAQVDPGVISLCNLIVAIGGIHDVDGQQVTGNIMSLTTEQRKALVRLGDREAIGFYGAGAYRRPVHGWTIDVPDPEGA